MLYPPMKDLLKKVNNRYLLVNIAAKRARDIAEEAEERGEPLQDKPVKIALEEIYHDKVVVCEDEEPGGDDSGAG